MPTVGTAAALLQFATQSLHGSRYFRYNAPFFLTGFVTMEINPILNTIKDLTGRSETIRGYL